MSPKLCGIRSVVMFCYVFFLKFQLQIGLHIAAVSAQQPVEHFKSAYQNIMTDRTPHCVQQ